MASPDEKLLRAVTESFTEVLKESLVGIYVHGSAAFGCYDPARSDLDYIAVVSSEPTLEQKVSIIKKTLAAEDLAPAKGLEMHVLSLSACKSFVHPCPFLLHYSAAYRSAATADTEGFCREMHGFDPDLGAHITVMNAVGYPLLGPAVKDVFSPVPREDYINSILFDVENAEEEISRDPVYFTLNLCRVLGYLRTGRVMSKADGGRWAQNALPEEFRPQVRYALKTYSGLSPETPDDFPSKAFARYVLREINKQEQIPYLLAEDSRL